MRHRESMERDAMKYDVVIGRCELECGKFTGELANCLAFFFNWKRKKNTNTTQVNERRIELSF